MGNVNRGFRMPPDNRTPEGDYCLVVYIPENTDYLINFFTVLDNFGKWNSWLREGDNEEKEVADRWKLANDKTHAAWAEGSLCMPPFRINLETCLLEVKCGDEWQPVKTTAFDPSTDTPIDPPYPSGVLPEGQSPPCVASANSIEYLKKGVGDFITAVISSDVLGILVAEVVNIIVGLINIAAAVAFPKVGAVLPELDVDSLMDDYDAFDWDALLCLILPHYDSEGAMSRAETDALLTQLESRWGDSQIYRLVWLLIELMGNVGMTQAANWAGLTEADCTACEECILFDSDFTVSDADFFTSNDYGSAPNPATRSASGWLGVVQPDGYYRGTIKRTSGAPFNGCTRVVLDIDSADGSSYFGIYNSSGVVANWSSHGTGLVTLDFTLPTVTDFDDVRIYWSGPSAGTGTMEYVRRLRLYC